MCDIDMAAIEGLEEGREGVRGGGEGCWRVGFCG